MSNNISLIEDHHEALSLWRKQGIKNLDLVHIDAHIDFGFPAAKPAAQVIREAKSLDELKRDLEQTLLFTRYEKDLDKQTNIGNYIYPAMNEGIVRDFYWVAPGGIREFQESCKILQGILRSLLRNHPSPITHRSLLKGKIESKFLGRKLIICILDKLPVFEDEILLDIDTDFLVIDSLKNANNTAIIGKRKPWIRPERLADALKKKIKKPVITTIAYSVNGGYTPMKYKHLGDELYLSLTMGMQASRNDAAIRLKAAECFNLFEKTGGKHYYQEAVKLNPSYQAGDNNYGRLYLSLGKTIMAEKEFRRVADADPKNPYVLAGLGSVYLSRKKWSVAKKHFEDALNIDKALLEAVSGLARSEFNLKEYEKAKVLFQECQLKNPLDAHSYYFLGRIYAEQKRFYDAVSQYRQAVVLGLSSIDVLYRLFKIILKTRADSGIIDFVSTRYKAFKEALSKVKKPNMKNKGISNKIAEMDRFFSG